MCNFGIVDLVDIVFANGASVSNIIKAREQYESAKDITIFNPSNLNGLTTLKVQVTPNPDAAVPDWYDLDTLGAVSTAKTLAIVAKGFRLSSATPASADTVFQAEARFLY